MMAGEILVGLDTEADVSESERFRAFPEDAIIAIVGPEGAGKTRFIRRATADMSIKENHEVGATEGTKGYRTEVDGQSIVLVDTPSFSRTSPIEADVLRYLTYWLSGTYGHEKRLIGILYLLDVGSMGPIMQLAQDNKALTKLVGDANMQNVILATTHWDTIGLAKGEARHKELVDRYWSHMIEQGSMSARFSGTTEDARSILRSFLGEKRLPQLNPQHMTMGEPENAKRYSEMTILQGGNAVVGTAYNFNARNYELDTTKLSTQAQRILELERRMKQIENRIEQLELGLNRRYGEWFRVIYNELKHRLSYPVHFHAEIDGAPAWIALARLRESGRKLLRRRVKTGFRRLEWRCSCGELLYGDYKDSVPGSLDKLAARLNQHSGQASQQAPSNSLQSPPKAHPRKSNSQMGWNLPTGTGNSGSNAPLNHAPVTTVSSPNVQQQQYLQLCVETSKYTSELGEVSADHSFSDGVLFEKIRAQYETTRHSFFPLSLRLSRPDKAIFVKFRVGTRPNVSLIDGKWEKPSIPPEQEVKAGNYVYDPCPIDEPPMDNRTFFHHFYGPASKHPDRMWAPRLPCKTSPGPLALMSPAWGIHLEECANWPLFAAFMFVILLVSGIIAGIYSWRTKDNQTGVAIGAWLTAVQAMGMTAVFFWRA